MEPYVMQRTITPSHGMPDLGSRMPSHAPHYAASVVRELVYARVHDTCALSRRYAWPAYLLSLLYSVAIAALVNIQATRTHMAPPCCNALRASSLP